MYAVVANKLTRRNTEVFEEEVVMASRELGRKAAG
jgi:hypothetical protein